MTNSTETASTVETWRRSFKRVAEALQASAAEHSARMSKISREINAAMERQRANR